MTDIGHFIDHTQTFLEGNSDVGGLPAFSDRRAAASRIRESASVREGSFSLRVLENAVTTGRLGEPAMPWERAARPIRRIDMTGWE